MRTSEIQTLSGKCEASFGSVSEHVQTDVLSYTSQFYSHSVCVDNITLRNIDSPRVSLYCCKHDNLCCFNVSRESVNDIIKLVMPFFPLRGRKLGSLIPIQKMTLRKVITDKSRSYFQKEVSFPTSYTLNVCLRN